MDILNHILLRNHVHHYLELLQLIFLKLILFERLGSGKSPVDKYCDIRQPTKIFCHVFIYYFSFLFLHGDYP